AHPSERGDDRHVDRPVRSAREIPDARVEVRTVLEEFRAERDLILGGFSDERRILHQRRLRVSREGDAGGAHGVVHWSYTGQNESLRVRGGDTNAQQGYCHENARFHSHSLFLPGQASGNRGIPPVWWGPGLCIGQSRRRDCTPTLNTLSFHGFTAR